MTGTAITAKEFKKTEIGLLPSEWEVATLGDLFHVQQGKALSPKSRRGIFPRPFLRTANVLWSNLDLSVVDQMDFSEEETVRLALQPGDLLICEGGDIGRTAMWRGELPACYYQNHIHRLRPKVNHAFPEYYMYWMRAALLLFDLYLGEANRTTIPNLSGARLKSFVVPVPPIVEQKKIAYVLSTVQSAIEETKAVIKAARELKKSLVKYLFTYGPVSIGEAENMPLKETETGLVPEGWSVKTLIQTVESIEYGYSISIPSEENIYGIPIVSTADITRDGSILYNQVRRVNPPKRLTERLLLRNGDVLFNWRNSPELVGKTAVYQEQSQRHIYASFIMRIRTDDSLNNSFLCYLLNYYRQTGVFLKLARRAVNQANYNKNEISVLRVLLPPLAAQHKIVDILSGVDRRIEAEENKKRALEALFKTLISNLTTGRTRINNLEVPV